MLPISAVFYKFDKVQKLTDKVGWLNNYLANLIDQIWPTFRTFANINRFYRNNKKCVSECIRCTLYSFRVQKAVPADGAARSNASHGALDADDRGGEPGARRGSGPRLGAEQIPSAVCKISKLRKTLEIDKKVCVVISQR